MAVLESGSVREGAQRRMANTAVDQAFALDAVRRGRPLEADSDRDRVVAYVQRLADVDRDSARRIVNYENPATMSLTPKQVSAAESLQGTTVDFLPIAFLDRAQRAAKAVARVVFPDRSPQGTGFLVAPGLFLTNQHVLVDRERARTFVLEFRYQLDADLREVPVARFALDPDRFFEADPEEDLDFALVAVGRQLGGPGALADFGYLPLSDDPAKHIIGGFVNVIQHPSGRPKELFVPRENRITARTNTTLIYGADTLPGSSGALVANDLWEPVALHHYGSPSRARRDPQADQVPEYGNEGIRVSAIYQHLRERLESLSGEPAQLLEAMLGLAAAASPGPVSGLEERYEVRNGAATTSPPPGGVQVRVDSTGRATWTIPLTVSVELGGLGTTAPPAPAAPDSGPTPPTPAPSAPKKAAPEALKPDPDYANREGYKAGFLGVPVALPKLSEPQEALAAALPNAGPEEPPFELKYQHFSVVMNAQRRLPFFTAVNIDGASVVKIDRKTGKVKSVEEPEEAAAEASEKWYLDTRIPAAASTDQSLYDDSALDHFQRGHLVKRTDPSWGSAERAVRGQADTFHFTNCSPQHEGFNPVTTRWAGVENWITKASDDDDLRMSVFSGPVFADDDPLFGPIRVPKAYWKIIVRVEEGELLATGIVADQSDLLKAPEGLGPLPAKLPQDYQFTIAAIEALTGLDFGSLRNHDTFVDGAEGASGIHRITRNQDLQIARPVRTPVRRSRVRGPKA